MEQRLSIFTVRAEDLEGATRYYVERLGWRPFLAVPGEVTFFQVGPGVALSLFDATGFDADVGMALRYPFMLAHNVASEEEVREVVRTMVEAGGTLIKEPQPAVWEAATVLVGVCVACLMYLNRRTRAVEIVR